MSMIIDKFKIVCYNRHHLARGFIRGGGKGGIFMFGSGRGVQSAVFTAVRIAVSLVSVAAGFIVCAAAHGGDVRFLPYLAGGLAAGAFRYIAGAIIEVLIRAVLKVRGYIGKS